MNLSILSIIIARYSKKKEGLGTRLCCLYLRQLVTIEWVSIMLLGNIATSMCVPLRSNHNQYFDPMNIVVHASPDLSL